MPTLFHATAHVLVSLCSRGVAPPGARRVTIYANGFCVDDGEFRPFGVEANDIFVQELKAG